MSKLITNTIRHTGGSADNITLDNSQNVTFEADAVVDGRVNIGSTGGFDSNGDDLTITNASHGGITIKTGTSSDGIIRFGDGSGAGEYRGYINYKHADDALVFGTSTNERIRIANDGKVYVNRTTALDSNYISFSATKALSAGIPQNQINIGDAAAYNTTDNGGAIGFSAKYSSGGASTTMASIEGVKQNNTDGNYGGDLIFKTRSHNGNNIERMRLNDGGLRLPSGYGINFAASSHYTGKTSEILSDYEEGTFTPTYGGTGTFGSNAYNTQVGYYTKIGRLVTISFYVQWNNATGGTGGGAIGGIPYTGLNGHQGAGAIMWTNINIANDRPAVVAHTSNNASIIYLYACGDDMGWDSMPYDSAGSILGTVSYPV